MIEQILGHLVILALTAVSVLSGFLWWKFDKREAQKLKKISNYAKQIKAYHLLEDTYIEYIKKYEPEKTDLMIKRACRKKFREDNDIEVARFLGDKDVEYDIQQ